jgi:signal transduction histidine kinase
VSDIQRRLERECARALSSLLSGGGEDALHSAYELGREALEAGLGVIDMAAIAQAACARAAAAGAAGPGPGASEAAMFLLECLSPFELAHRGAREANAALRRIQEVREEEVRRLAHEIHDQSGQMLAVVHLALNSVTPHLSSGGVSELERARARLRDVESQLRRISHELRPTMLDDLGLIPALRFLSEGVASRSGLNVRVEGFLNERLPPAGETAFYRVAQEALRNVVRHARASTVTLRVETADDAVSLRIRDDGVGFDSGAAAAAPSGPGLGLIGMRERIAALNGCFELRSAPGSGTELCVALPAGGPERVAPAAGR